MDSNIKGNYGENLVNQLAFDTYLDYWCYPNPKFENGNKKEICDLLIVFNNVCIIISVKNYEFKGNHKRYFNNTIEKAVKQINGAYKTLFTNEKIIIKHPYKNEIIFPKDKIDKVYRIIINLGEGIQFYNLERTTQNQDFITIFDKDTFTTILKELDTIPDLIDYLDKREILFKNKDVKILPGPNDEIDIQSFDDFAELFNSNNDKASIIISGTEKDLLSYFIKNTRNFPEAISGNYDSSVIIIDREWEKFKSIEKVKKKTDEDKISYFVDKFVKNEILPSNYDYKDEIAKELLSLNRLNRRFVSKLFFDFYNQIKNHTDIEFDRRYVDLGELGIVFTNYTEKYTFEMINKVNTIAMESFNYYNNYKNKNLILISTNKNYNFFFAIEKDIKPYSADDEEIIKKNIKTLGWFENYKTSESRIDEFPE
jgi:hypothetical protein